MNILGFTICPHCVMLGAGALVPLSYMLIVLKRLFRRY